MRSNQKNNRSRGRGNNNNRNKNSNPLTRSYDSNGPDVRVRGNASTVAEKYQQLARDAHATGDSVAAENYLQHAEHYFRIISAAQVQQAAQLAAQQQAQAARAEQQQQQNNNQEGRFENRSESQSGENSEPSTGGNTGNDTPADKPVTGKPAESRPLRVSRPRRRSVSAKPAVEKSDADQSVVKKPVDEKPAVKKSKNVVAADKGDSNASEGDPANAPQPEVNELPAFVTSSPDSSAVE